MELVLFRKNDTENGMVEVIDGSCVNLMISFFIKKNSISQNDKINLTQLCQRIYERDWWVKCGCQGDKGNPFFRFNVGPSGKLYLRRITTRGPHSNSCPFKESSIDVAVSDSVKPLRYKKGALSDMLYRSSGIRASSKNNSKSIQSNKASCSRNSKLARLLYTMMEKSGVNKASFIEGDYSPAGKKIFTACSQIEFVPKKKLSYYLYLNIQKLTNLDDRLRHDISWPANAIKHGFIMAKVKQFENDNLTCLLSDSTEKMIKVENRVYVSSGRFGERTGPYVALIMVADTVENPNVYKPYNAYMQPCYNEKSYFPVDSYYERVVLKNLYALGFRLKKRGVHVEIKKPLFDIPVYEGKEEEFCLPDFIVSSGTKRIIIEVNGSHEPEYLERKARTHALMKKLGCLLSIDAYGAELKGNLDQAIYQLCSEIESKLKN